MPSKSNKGAERTARASACTPGASLCWLCCWAVACGASADRVTLETPSLESVPGYPETTSRLELDLGGSLQKWCHASLVDPSWAVTAAHCFSSVDPAARGVLPDWSRSFAALDVEFYPGAHQGGETQLSGVWRRQDFVAADDLALVPIDPPLTALKVPANFGSSDHCAPPPLSGLVGTLGLRDDHDAAFTAEAAILGEVDAAQLLGPGQPGRLLSARGPFVEPGDSGSGMSIDGALLEPALAGCDASCRGGRDSTQLLVGVVQDANPDDGSLPFGLVALYEAAHATWLAGLLCRDTPPEPR